MPMITCSDSKSSYQFRNLRNYLVFWIKDPCDATGNCDDHFIDVSVQRTSLAFVGILLSGTGKI